MDKTELNFDEETHTYTKGEKKFLSVTQLIGKVTNKFDADKIIDKMLKGQDIYLGAKTELIGMTKEEIKQLWGLNNKAKSRYGSFIHEGAEDIALKFKGGIKDYKPDRPELRQALSFFKKEGYEVIEAEKMVHDDYYGIAGTMDLLLFKDGMYYVGDWKTNIGKDLSDSEGNKWTDTMNTPLTNIPDLHFWVYALQFSIYRYIMERNLDLKPFGGQIIIHLQESQKNCPYNMPRITYKVIETPYLKAETKNLLNWYKHGNKAD